MNGTCTMHPGVLSAAECEALIAAAERDGFQATGNRYPGGYRDNDRLVRDDAELAAWLWERIRGQLPELDGEKALGLNPRFRFCRYRDGQQFTVHRDGAWAKSGTERTRLTVQVYLNDAAQFTGGSTRFTQSGLSVAPRTGMAIVFDHRLWHEGTAVTGGTKYVLRTDVVYPFTPKQAERAEGGALREAARFDGHLGYVWSAVPARDGRIYSGSRDGTVRAWPGGEVLLQVESSVTAVAEDGDGAVWAGTRAGDVYMNGKKVTAHAGSVLAMARLSNGRVVSAGADGAIRIGERELRVGGGWLWSVCEAEPGRLLVGCDDGCIRTVDLEWWEVASVEQTPSPVHAVAREFAGLADGRLWSGGRAREAHHGIVTGAVVLAEGVWATSSEDGTVALWEGKTGRKLGEGRCDDFVRSVAAVSDSLVTASYDGTVRRWVVDFEPL